MSPPDSGPASLAHDAADAQTLLPLDIAFADYDRTRPLVDGRVKAEGLRLNTTVQWIGEFCTRPVYEEYDAAEMSLSWYVAARDRGEPCIAIPAFLLRDAVWGYMYTRAELPLIRPEDLNGRRIGVIGYRYSVYCWLRGLLSEHYGFRPESATWVTLEAEGNGFVVPADIRVERRADKKTLPELLRDGEVDCIWLPRVPKVMHEGTPWIRRLFPDAQAEMHRFVQRTGITPITHVVVMKERLAKEKPWVAQNLYRAFVAAQKCADEPCNVEKMLSYMDHVFLLEQQRAIYGTNPFSHGLSGNNRVIMDTFARYAWEQGYTSRRLTVEGLFVTETLGL